MKKLIAVYEAYVAAWKRERAEYRDSGRWHCDCPCGDCKAIWAYLDLTKWQKFRLWLSGRKRIDGIG
jgi:hypothetical protein